MVFYVVRSYLRDHPELLETLVTQGPIRALRDFLIALWRRLVGLAEAASERILYYYLSILRRAERQGFPRQRAQTPYEYDATLGPHLPQAQQEMDLLTHAFVEARYSHHTGGRPGACTPTGKG